MRHITLFLILILTSLKADAEAIALSDSFDIGMSLGTNVTRLGNQRDHLEDLNLAFLFDASFHYKGSKHGWGALFGMGLSENQSNQLTPGFINREEDNIFEYSVGIGYVFRQPIGEKWVFDYMLAPSIYELSIVDNRRGQSSTGPFALANLISFRRQFQTPGENTTLKKHNVYGRISLLHMWVPAAKLNAVELDGHKIGVFAGFVISLL